MGAAPTTGIRTPKYRRKGPGNRPRPRGDRWVDARGYVRVRTAVGRGVNWTYEHRLAAEAKIGRPLLPNEVVHHINENKQDNRPENLEVMDRAAHIALHNTISPKRQRRSA